MLKYLVVFAMALFSCLLITPWVKRLAFAVSAVDQPGEHRVSRIPVARLGGLAIYLTLVVTFLLAGVGLDLLLGRGTRIAALIVAASTVLILGLIDDRLPLTPSFKLVVEVLAASVAVLAGYRIRSVVGIDVGILAYVVTIIWVVAVTNAISLVDTLDGLATGISVIVSTTLFSIAVLYNQFELALLLAGLIGALLGFLRYNLHPAQILLGDSGALLIGFLLGVVSIRLTDKLSMVVAISVPMLALGLPLAEVTLTALPQALQALHLVRIDADSDKCEFFFFRRHALFSVDRSFLQSRLTDLGITHKNAVFLLYAVSLLIGAAAFILVFVRGAGQGFMLAAFAIAGFIGIRTLGHRELRPFSRGLLLPVLEMPVISLGAFQLLFDLASIATAYSLAWILTVPGSLDETTHHLLLQTLPLVCLFQLIALILAGTYGRSFRRADLADVLSLGGAVIFAALTGWAAMYLGAGMHNPRAALVVLDAYLVATLVIGSRITFGVLSHLFEIPERKLRRVMVYGPGDSMANLLAEARRNGLVGIEIVGLVAETAFADARGAQEIPVYKPENLASALESSGAEELVVFSLVSAAKLQELVSVCSSLGVSVRRVSKNIMSVKVA